MTPPAAPFVELDACQHESWERESSCVTEGYCPICQAAQLNALKAAHAAAATAARNDALEEAARVLDTTFPDDWSEWAAAKIRALAAQGKG